MGKASKCTLLEYNFHDFNKLYYSATNSTGATEKNRHFEMLSFLIVLQTTKADSFVVNVTCDWLVEFVAL